jgi:hypothetical protein
MGAWADSLVVGTESIKSVNILPIQGRFGRRHWTQGELAALAAERHADWVDRLAAGLVFLGAAPVTDGLQWVSAGR